MFKGPLLFHVFVFTGSWLLKVIMALPPRTCLYVQALMNASNPSLRQTRPLPSLSLAHLEGRDEDAPSK